MTIVRNTRKPRDRFTVVPNHVLGDVRLSWKARGLLAHLLGMPDGWQTSADRLARLGPDGRTAILSALSELEEVGYIRRYREQDPRSGRITTRTVVYDEPQPRPAAPVHNPGDEPGTTGDPGVRFPDVGEPDPLEKTPSKDLEPDSPVARQDPWIPPEPAHRYRLCARCEGTGRQVAGDGPEAHVDTCPTCRGAGTVKAER